MRDDDGQAYITFGAIIKNTSLALTVSDLTKPDQPMVFANAAFSRLTGYPAHEALGRNTRFLQGPDTDAAVVAEIRQAIAAGASIRREILNYRKNGEPFWNDMQIDPIHDAAGTLVGFVGAQYDATALHGLRDAQRAVESRLQNIMSRVPGYIYRRVMNAAGAIDLAYLSPSINRLLGVPEGETIDSQRFYAHVHPDDLADLLRAVRQSAAHMTVFHEEFRLVAADGEIRWIRSDAPARLAPNGDVIWDGLALDITAEKTSQSKLAFLAFHDTVTGLSNRELFKTTFLEMVTARPHADTEMGVFFIDLDAFQDINDTFGSTVGDEILRAVGARLTQFVGDRRGAVARLGGDEFAVLLPLAPAGRSASDIASSLCDDIARPMRLGAQEIIVQACVGAALAPKACLEREADGASAVVEIMKRADLALRAAKREGQGSYRLYSAELDDRQQNQMALRQSLPHAIAQGQLRLHYQPLVDLGTGRIVGAEALVRWRHPQLGMIRPDLFIALAETSGLIVPLGAWVMEEAMRQAQEWQAQSLAPLRIAINVSSVQLVKPGFVAMVQQALATTGADARHFELELTEGLLIEASPEVLDILRALKSLGFAISIDDFGAGHATFKYLRDFPIDKLKIDQIFIRQLVIDSSDAFIIRAIIALASSLGLQVVAEGVETEMQRDFLRAEGCDTGQGYLFSRPLPAEDLGGMLKRNVVLPMAGPIA